MTTLIIARHGNTFGPGDTPTRVGRRTDLPLVEKGEEQARVIGIYLKENNMIPDVVYSSCLKRTYDTARIAIKASGVSNPVFQLDMFDEIDYGPDENKPEDEVIARIGAAAIEKWDKEAIVPDGWIVDPQEIIGNWRQFAAQIVKHSSSDPLSECISHPSELAAPDPRLRGDDKVGNDGETVLVVTSNGIARFAPYLTGDFERFAEKHDIKLSTGALGILKHEGGVWRVKAWNVRP